MRRTQLGAAAVRAIALGILLSTTSMAMAQEAKTAYPHMAPIEQYMMDRDAEIALARSAAPESIARDADVLVLGRHGYETAVHGKNGFVCFVDRAWTSPLDDPNFWNPHLRGPLCVNAAAARSYLPHTFKKTEVLLAGGTKEQMVEAVKAAIAKKELPAIEPGAMSYMLSKQGYLSDNGLHHWHPHLMFFSPAEPAAWGADQPGSPILTLRSSWEGVTIFLVPVRKWSDGTADQ